MQEISDISSYFPIPSQTTLEDRFFLVRLMHWLGETTGEYNYLEIGSFLGGSLAPFLNDPHCRHITSIDDRGRKQPDERGAVYDYTEFTSAAMLKNLTDHGCATDKLSTFDESIEELGPLETRFDLAFIDGEHTDAAAFRDFLHVRDYLKTDCVVAFHDSLFIPKAIKSILIMLDKESRSENPLQYQFYKRKDSLMSCIFFGKYASVDATEILGQADETEAYLTTAQDGLLDWNIRNRVKFDVEFQLTHPSPFKFLNRCLRAVVRRTVKFDVKHGIERPPLRQQAR